MLQTVRRWLTPGSAGGKWGGLPAWAAGKGWQFKPTSNPRGFVLVDPVRQPDGRIEWGPSHRDYLGIYELRVRAATGAPADLQAVLMPVQQMSAITDSLKAAEAEGGGNVMQPPRHKGPEEISWLSSLPRPTPNAMGRLAGSYGAASSHLPWLHGWLASDLTDALHAWTASVPAAASPTPMVLMNQHSTLVLRVALPDPDVAGVERALALFDVALREARRISHLPDDVPEPVVKPERRRPAVRR